MELEPANPMFDPAIVWIEFQKYWGDNQVNSSHWISSIYVEDWIRIQGNHHYWSEHLDRAEELLQLWQLAGYLKPAYRQSGSVQFWEKT